MEPKEEDIRVIVGRNVKIRREAHNILQDTLAASLHERGLKWTAARVSRLEKGHKAVAVEDLILIADALSELTDGPVRVGDLIDGDGKVKLSESVRVPRALASKWFNGVPVDVASANDPDTGPAINPPSSRIFEVINKDPQTKVRYDRLMGERADDPETFEALLSPGLADVTLAKKLRVPTADVLCAAIGIWGSSLTHERDRIVGAMETAPGLKGERRRTTIKLAQHVQERLQAEARGELSGRE